MISGNTAASRTNAGLQHARITQAADEPANRGLVVADPLHVGNLLVSSQDLHRDGVLVDVQAKMDRGKVPDTGPVRSPTMLRRGRAAG